MLSVFRRDYSTQKELYYALQSAFSLADNPELRKSPAGCYVIFHGDKCLYVGQSKNLPSRISTHLWGAYSHATKVLFYTIKNKFYDFDNLKREKQKRLLEINEKALMRYYKPIDNILVDFDSSINNDDLTCRIGIMIEKNYYTACLYMDIGKGCFRFRDNDRDCVEFTLKNLYHWDDMNIDINYIETVSEVWS